MAIDVMDREQKSSALQPLDMLIAARQQSGEPAWLQALRAAARAQLNTAGLPGKRWESWHYSAADLWLQQFNEKHGLAPIAAAVGQDATTELASPNQLQFSHGHLCSRQLADPVTLLPLAQLDAEKHAEIIAWLQSHPHTDSLAALATALSPQSWVLIVPANTQLTHPLVISHHTSQPGAQIAQVIVWVETGANATVLETFGGAAGAALQIAHTQAYIGRNARLTYARLNRDGNGTQHLGVFEGDLMRDAHLRAQVLRGGHADATSSQKQRNGLYIRLQENGADFTARGAFAAAGTQHIDYHITVDHNADHGRCDMQVQGIAGDRSRGVVNGRIFIAKNTRGNDGHFTSHNLLLTADAEIDAKPELEIFADEVRCDHGATVGQLDEEQLLYLQTRGIDQVQAIALLTEGFLKAGLLDCGNAALNDYLQVQLLASIGGGV